MAIRTMIFVATALLVQSQDDISKMMESLRTKNKDLGKMNEELVSIQNQYEQAHKAGQKDKVEGLAKKYEETYKAFDKKRTEIITDYKSSIDTLSKAIEKDPKKVENYKYRAECSFTIGEQGSAVADLLKARELSPEDKDLATMLKSVLKRSMFVEYEANHYEKAIEYAKKFLEMDKDYLSAAALIGICQFSLNNFEEARKQLQSVVDAKPAGMEISLDQVKSYLDQANQYIEFWKKENEIRMAEDKAGDNPRVRITTDVGDIELELYENQAPNTVANFISLVESKLYEGTTFHRVLPNFMVQGGDPKTKDPKANPQEYGSGGPGYKFDDELPKDKFRLHFRGAISMANSGPNTNGSQFFITHHPTYWLNGKHVVFGRVIKGQEIVDNIKQGNKITKVEVVRKRNHEYKPVTKPEK